jgi:N-acetyl-anhydromuramyl-L-alanine amidase AmpD
MDNHLKAILTAVSAFLVAVVALITALVGPPSTTTTKTIETPIGHALKLGSPPLGDLQTPTPLQQGGTAPQTVDHNKANEGKLSPPHAVGGAQNYTCKHFFGGHLYSSRNGVRPTEIVFHYTAGLGTVFSIDHFFRSTRAASATDIMEPSGRCIQEVPESQKPWTQLAANPYSISIEIVTTGWNVSRAQWLGMGIFRKGILAQWTRDVGARNGIPMRRVNPVGCNFIPGYTDHNSLECGNNHTDVQPNFPWDVLARQISGRAPSKPNRCSARRVQAALNAHGAKPHLVVDGTVGTRTRSAIIRFKRAHHLTVDAHVGRKAGRLLGLKGCK